MELGLRSTNGTAASSPSSRSAGIRYGSHHPVRSSITTRLPSLCHRGWPTETSVRRPPDGRRRCRSRRTTRPDRPPTPRIRPTTCRGWLQVIQHNRVPSRDGRERPEASGVDQRHHLERTVGGHRGQPVPGAGIVVPLLDTEQPVPRGGERPVGVPNRRTRPRCRGERNRGPTVSDRRPVQPLVLLVDIEQRPPDNGGRSPPYSWTRLRMLTVGGDTSTGAPPAPPSVTITSRPPSSGRLSNQNNDAPSACNPERDTFPAATWPAANGDGHHPNRSAGVGRSPGSAFGSPRPSCTRYGSPHACRNCSPRPGHLPRVEPGSPGLLRLRGRTDRGFHRRRDPDLVGRRPACRRRPHPGRMVGAQLQGRHGGPPATAWPGIPVDPRRRTCRHRGMEWLPRGPAGSSSTATTSGSPTMAASPSTPGFRPTRWCRSPRGSVPGTRPSSGSRA